MVISESTVLLTGEELEKIQSSLKQSDEAALREFRDAFDPDDMGFAGRKEGI